VLGPADLAPEEAEIAVCPGARSAMIYALNPDDRAAVAARAATDLLEADGVDLVAHLSDGEARVRTPRGELRFAPGGDLADGRDGSWSLEGEHAALDLAVGDGRVTSEQYPDALGRLWSALSCPSAGDLLVSAAAGNEFVDWGGGAHVGGGSHGSLHRDDSLGALIYCGTGPEEGKAPDQWRIADVTPMVLDHFGVDSKA